MFLTHIKAGIENVEQRFPSHCRITRYIVARPFPSRRLPGIISPGPLSFLFPGCRTCAFISGGPMFLRRKWFDFKGLFRLPSGSQNVMSLFTKRVLSPHHLVGAVLGAGGHGTGN